MKHSKFLLPYGFKTVGYVLLALGVAGLVLNFCGVDFGRAPGDGMVESGLLFTLSGLALVLGCLFAGFSRYREEDEYVEQLRHESMLLAFYLYVALLVAALCFTWGVAYLYFVSFGIFAVLVVYVVCLTLRVAIARKSLKDEE